MAHSLYRDRVYEEIVPLARDADETEAILWDTHVNYFAVTQPSLDPAEYKKYALPGDPDLAALLVNPFERYQRDAVEAGLERFVFVESCDEGQDHASALQFLAAGDGTNRAVVVPQPTWPRAHFEALHMAGVRGVRLNLRGVTMSTERAEVDERFLAPVLPHLDVMRALGWHIALLLDVTNTPVMLSIVHQLPGIPLVLDHFGAPAVGSMKKPYIDFAALYFVMDETELLVKITAPYPIAHDPAPQEDVFAIGVKFCADFPTRVLFASHRPYLVPCRKQLSVPQMLADVGRMLEASGLSAYRLNSNAKRLYL